MPAQIRAARQTGDSIEQVLAVRIRAAPRCYGQNPAIIHQKTPDTAQAFTPTARSLSYR